MLEKANLPSLLISTMHNPMLEITRKQAITHLLLTCLLLAASSRTMVQAIESVNFQLGIKQPRFQLANEYDKPRPKNTRQVSVFKKVQKVPSGPSPIGNAHPPVRP